MFEYAIALLTASMMLLAMHYQQKTMKVMSRRIDLLERQVIDLRKKS